MEVDTPLSRSTSDSYPASICSPSGRSFLPGESRFTGLFAFSRCTSMDVCRTYQGPAFVVVGGAFYFLGKVAGIVGSLGAVAVFWSCAGMKIDQRRVGTPAVIIRKRWLNVIVQSGLLGLSAFLMFGSIAFDCERLSFDFINPVLSFRLFGFRSPIFFSMVTNIWLAASIVYFGKNVLGIIRQDRKAS